MKLAEAYFLYPWMGPAELAKLCGMTFDEVVEQCAKRGLPGGLVFERQIAKQENREPLDKALPRGFRIGKGNRQP